MARWRSANFLDLPVELICHVLSYLCIPDLLRCASLTAGLRKVIISSSRLQYAIELSKHRMISIRPPSSSPPYASRLRILTEREQTWKYLTWKGRYKLNLPPTGSVYEFVGGFYGNGREDDRRITASISFLELPSADSARLENGYPDLKMWTHPMFDIIIIDFTMDPSQDLLVLIALAPPGSAHVYELHLRSLSTNEPHCKAPMPVLPCLFKPSTVPQATDHIAPVRVQVSGDLVALLVKEVHDSTGAHLEIWDWLNRPQVSCKLARTSGIDDFTFLSRDAFLLARPTGSLEVYTFQNPITASTVPFCQASYGLPPLSDGYMYWYITMSSNPAPGSVPRPCSSTDSAHGRAQQLYYPHPDERIHACCLYVFNPTEGHEQQRVHSFVFFVNLNTLLHPPAEWLQKPAPRFKVLKFRNLLRRTRTSSVDSTSSSEMETDAFPTTPAGQSSAFITEVQPGTFPPPPYLHSPITYSLSPLINAPSMPFPSTSALLPSSSNHSHSLHSTPSSSSSTSTSNTSVFTPVHIQTPAEVAWSVWGPQSTRWFRECLSTDWQHSIYGLRTIESLIPDRVLKTAQRPMPDFGKPGDGENTLASATEMEQSPVADAGALTNGAAISSGLTNSGTTTSQNTQSTANSQGGGNSGNDIDQPIPLRHLRLRDFNPYSVRQQLQAQQLSDKKGKKKMDWREPTVVTERSTMDVKGIFKHDITSWLPYVEVVSEEKFEVTDVMMDDCRLLLLRRGRSGRLRRVDVLTM